MGKELTVRPLSNLLFNPTNILQAPIPIDDVECKTNKELTKANTLFLYCFELGNTLVFYKDSSFGSKILLELPIPDIISTEVSNQNKMIGKKWFLTIKTIENTIVIRAQEQQVKAIKTTLYAQKKRQTQANKSKEINFTSGGFTKTLSICPYSPITQEGEELILSYTYPEIGYAITNYRVWKNYFLEATDKSKSLTHEEYEDAIASNVEKWREEDTVGGVNERPSMWNFVQNSVKIQYNEEAFHSSSTESELGDIVFMNDGKQVMVWKNFPDPHGIIKMINSAKAHFNTTSTTASSSREEDPIRALKLRFAKGEITKDEFEEMKKVLED